MSQGPHILKSHIPRPWSQSREQLNIDMLPHFSRKNKLGFWNVYEGVASVSRDTRHKFSTLEHFPVNPGTYNKCTFLPVDVVLSNAIHCFFSMALHYMCYKLKPVWTVELLFWISSVNMQYLLAISLSVNLPLWWSAWVGIMLLKMVQGLVL